MGVDYTKYLGPYIECMNERGIEPFDISEGISERLHFASDMSEGDTIDSDNCHHWMPNIQPKGYMKQDLSDNETGTVDLTEINIANAIIAFKTQFEDEIAVLLWSLAMVVAWRVSK